MKPSVLCDTIHVSLIQKIVEKYQFLRFAKCCIFSMRTQTDHLQEAGLTNYTTYI